MSSAAAYSRLKLCISLWLAGMLGIVLVITTHLPKMIPGLMQGRELPLPMWMLLSASIVQAGLLLAFAVWVGKSTAPALGLRAPAFEAAAAGQRIIPHLLPQLRPGLVFGLLVGLFLFAANTLGPDVWVAIQESYYPSLINRLLYGGITEELLLRWGFMSTVTWLLWRIFQRRGGRPRAGLVWLGIVISAACFGVAHLPAVGAAVGGLDTNIIVFIVGGNTIAGTTFGWLYWRYGLESAMAGHAVAHLVNYLLGLM